MTWNPALGPYHMSEVDAAPFRAVLEAIVRPWSARYGVYPISKTTGVSVVTLYAILRGQPTISAKTAAALRRGLPALLPSGEAA